MKQRYRTLVLMIPTVLLCTQLSWAQSNYIFYSKNVAVLGNDTFSHVECGDVWGIKISGTPDKHYALSTLGGGLSIALVNGTSPAYYNEVAYINKTDTTSHDFKDVETFVVNNTVYAGMKELTVEEGGTLDVKSESITQLRRDGIIRIRGRMNARLTENEWARFDGDASGYK